ncbi:MAG: RNA polymerase sigma factor [Bacteroidales bacterium]
MENERFLLKQLKDGNEKAFRQVIINHQEMVYRTAYGFFHNQAEAEDLSQEVFTELFQSIHKFKGHSKLSTWLYRITINKSLNEVKKKKNQKSMQETASFFNPEASHAIEVKDDQNYDPQRIQENQERKTILNQAIDSLPEQQKTAFILHKYDGMAYKKIAEVMNTSLASVESLMHRAKHNLQKKLIHYYNS